MRNICLPDGFDLSPTGKDCFLVECAADADCCDDFVPDANCSFYQSTCDADPTQCLAFITYCQCNETCDAERCIDETPTCLEDMDCPFVGAPYCAGGRCAACREHGDCPGAEDRCVDGECQSPCAADTECPLLHTCDGGTCVATGCQTDRECVFVLADSRAICRDTVCEVGCTTDLECDGGAFEICDGGRCRFAGCTTDEECRAYLDLEYDFTGAEAVCR